MFENWLKYKALPWVENSYSNNNNNDLKTLQKCPEA